MDTGHPSTLRKPGRGKTMLGKGSGTEKNMESGFTLKSNKEKKANQNTEAWGK